MEAEPPEWAGWMAAAQQGDRDSYRRLLQSVGPVLARIVRGRWPRAEAADVEDAVQETLIALHSARHLYHPTRPLLPFLIGLLRYRGLDVLRRRRRIAEAETALDDTEPNKPGETFFPFDMDNSQEAAVDGVTLRQEIGRLPQQQRQALQLMKLEGMSLKEASAASGMSITALKVATHRAIQSLRKRLGVGP